MDQAADGAQKSKSIILFSDGTGNSSAKLFKTNVWRMYEAVDLGPGPAEPDQVALYDNGVGTSSIKILAMLGGVFGFGLKRNILRLYRFACRNYARGDRIYAFGFSRGAFTIRMVVALIAQEGIVRYSSERELTLRSLDAFRRFNSANNPNFFPFFAIAGRAIRNFTVWLKRSLSPRLPAPKEPYRPEIEFVGVWDTVAAYGGPITEITRAIDNWIWPLSMTDYQLSPKVRIARHALALDDQRDSFHPLLWDEFHQSVRAERAAKARTDALAAANEAEAAGDKERQRHWLDEAAAQGAAELRFKTRMQQVWFSGMHADVGGGYPDESLSFVSLRWMMAEADAAGLRILPVPRARIEQMSNSFGPIHNSREGFASYYRYQPRKITAYLHPESQSDDAGARAKARIMRETLSLRDPTLGEQNYRPQGTLLACKVHESVIARITSGTDDYAPITLPDKFDIVPPAPDQAPKPGSLIYDWQKWKNIEKSNLVDAAGVSPRGDRQESVWDDVLKRRLTYFATLVFTAVLLSLPMWVDKVRFPRTTDGRWVWKRITDGINAILPDFLDPWIRALEISPFIFLGLAILIWRAMTKGTAIENRIKDRTRELWTAAMAGTLSGRARQSRLRNSRNSYGYQRGLQILKWGILPNLLFGPLLIALMAYPVAIVASQIALAFDEREICRPSAMPLRQIGSGIVIPAPGGAAEAPALGATFATWEPCNYTGAEVRKGRRYGIMFRVTGDWKDGTANAHPQGIAAGKLGLAGYLGVPFRRIVHAKWMQPLYEVRPIDQPERRLASIHINELKLARVTGDPVGNERIFFGEFEPLESGELFLFANEAAHPADTCYFYAAKGIGNVGTADVIIRDLGPARTFGEEGRVPLGSLQDWLDTPVAPAARPEKALTCTGWSGKNRAVE